MISEALSFVFPLPIRWVGFLLYGLFLFNLDIRILKQKFDVDMVSLLTGSENDQVEEAAEKISHLIVFLLAGYIALCFLTLVASSWIVPLTAYPLILVLLTMPIQRLSLSYRYSLISCLKRILFNGWRTPTKFNELLLADILTSYAKIFADWDALLWCYILSPIVVPFDYKSGKSCSPTMLSVLLVW